jgi:acetyltransferase-like isoleucine patch superfamily enzyme
MGEGVTIVDSSHGHNTLEEADIAPSKRKLYSKGGVIIDDNVWIGDKATILAGVHIGYGAIIGANAVVTKDIPKYSIAVGNPARILSRVE